MQRGMDSLSSLGKVARVVLGIFIAGCALTILIQGAAITSFEFFLQNPQILGIFIASVVGIMLLTFLASIVVVALWLHRAHSNLHEAGLVGLNYTPAWATASFFIPFVNLYIPFTSTRELYNRSHGESDWHAAATANDVTSWIACNWGAFTVFCVMVGYIMVDSIPYLHVVMPSWAWVGLAAILYLLVAGSAWFLFQVVSKITAAQTSGVHLSQSDVFA